MLSISKSNYVIQEISTIFFQNDKIPDTFDEYNAAFKLQLLNTTVISVYLKQFDHTFANLIERINNYYIKQKRPRSNDYTWEFLLC